MKVFVDGATITHTVMGMSCHEEKVNIPHFAVASALSFLTIAPGVENALLLDKDVKGVARYLRLACASRGSL